jgi:hypothetical protein
LNTDEGKGLTNKLFIEVLDAGGLSVFIAILDSRGRSLASVLGMGDG